MNLAWPPRDGAVTSGSALRLIIIHNRSAGRRRDARYRAIAERLARDGCRLEEWPTERRGDAEAFAAALAPDACDRLVVAGGDGTLNEVVNGLLANPAARALPLALMPLGTANVLASEIALKPSGGRVSHTIRVGDARPVTVGRVNGRAFLLMAGAGLDARVVAAVDRGDLKRHLGRGAYLIEYLRQMRRFQWPTYRVEIDGSMYEANSVVVSNAARYAGGFVMASSTRIDAPHLEVVLFRGSRAWHGLKFAGALAAGQLARRRDVQRVQGSRVEISGPPGDPVQVDGDDTASLPADISLEPGALKLVFPADR